MGQLLKIIDIVLPVFLIVALGYGLGRRGMLRTNVNGALSKLVFWVAAPCLLFRGAAHTRLSEALDWRVVGTITLVSAGMALVVYLAGWRQTPARRGVTAQGTYRSNMVFVGLPVIINAFGSTPEVLGVAAIIIGFIAPVYNFLAVVVLTAPHAAAAEGAQWRRLLKDIVGNPLIISCVLGFAWSGLLGKPTTGAFDITLDLLGKTAMPLALLVVGATIDFAALRSEFKLTALVACLRLFAYPALVYLVLAGWGVGGIPLKISVLMMATPTAVVSHIMAREMKGDDVLATSIVVGTTIYSIATMSFWVYLLV